MEGICGKQSHTIDTATLAGRLAGYTDILIDVGTGDGRYVLHSARACASRFAIGIDACRENLRVAARAAPCNALFVIAEARAFPAALRGLATQITINFPWGSLLAGLLEGHAGLLEGLATAARPGTAIEIRLNGGALAEQGWSLEAGGDQIRQALVTHGLSVGRPQMLDARALRACPSTWAKRLAFGRDPRGVYLAAKIPRAVAIGD
jgi:16S rRNA (adenine(1408)-N(1))-methyltransferase